ncbi:MAG: helix-turn-helix domain-containing protein [Firmicutes bacterium]|nr:helix-turn-helix domain-containing protein [Bacillota bacterium]
MNNTENFDIYKEAFADSLLEFMDEKSIEQFAKMIGIPSRTIRDWLKKTYLPKSEYLIILAKKFNCSIDYLLGLES